MTRGGFAAQVVGYRAVLLIGAVGAVGFLLRATSRNPSPLLVALLALWVASPFLILLLVGMRSPLSRRALLILSLGVTLGTLGIYLLDALQPRAAQAAFFFIVVPPVSWVLIAFVVLPAALMSRRRQGA